MLTAQVQTSNNNQSALQATITETDQVRASAVIFQPTGLLANPTNDVPNVTTAAQGDIGAALGNVGQEGTPAQQPGGGGNPCFIGQTKIDTPRGDVHIRVIRLGDIVWAFDAVTGTRVHRRVIGKWEHLVDGYTLVEFSDGRSTGVMDIHRYWQKNGQYQPVKDIDSVWHWDGEWKEAKIVQRTVIKGETVVYNLTVENDHNYLANGDAVSNLKPLVENNNIFE